MRPTSSSHVHALTPMLTLILALLAAPTPATAQPYDVLITGGTVVDGTGADRFTADVAITDGRIALVSRQPIDPSQAATVIDARGQVVTPGFIDNHSHVQQTIAEYPLAENFLRQGITTLIASLHSGDQPWPMEEFASSLEMAPNVGFFAGHTWTRKQVMGMENRAPTAEELEGMKALVDQSMRDGALGLSTGLAVRASQLCRDRGNHRAREGGRRPRGHLRQPHAQRGQRAPRIHRGGHSRRGTKRTFRPRSTITRPPAPGSGVGARRVWQ